ncbi:MAG: hypothetical protein JWL60_846 [Gemmatimonadetes bacterium]|jgi:regulator of cell morphogenesis and NO signaling|nr:hypothetical protein [Gemmatimonadota bacterium]
MPAHTPSSLITPTMTVNQVLASHPSTAALFNAYAVDTCCGGEATLAEAAADAGVPLHMLLATLRALSQSAHPIAVVGR